MHTRVVAAVAAAVAEIDGGARVNVTALSADLGIAPKTFYKWADRYRREGLAGLEERSRRPLRSPQRIPLEIEDRIVAIRKDLADLGLDHGPSTIGVHLDREGIVVSDATIWRTLVRRGFVTPEPKKRPKASFRRFEAPAPNEWWQIDATEWRLTTRKKVEIINVIDDHSRVCADSFAVSVATTQAAWEAFSRGVQRLGLPRGCLSDNGLIFSGRLRGCEVFFEQQLRAAGVRPITSRPYHPQTCGKVERFQQTLKKWLRKHPARTIEELQEVLDEFRDYYNHQRPHRGINRQTPWHRFSSTTPAAAPTAALAAPVIRVRTTVTKTGVVSGNNWRIQLGKNLAGQPALVIVDQLRATVFVNDQLVKDFALNEASNYQPSGHRAGSKPKAHLNRECVVRPNGSIALGRWIIPLGAEHIGHTVNAIRDGVRVVVTHQGTVIRDFEADPAKTYQPLRNGKGRPIRLP